MGRRVLVGMSGGVDSSICASLLLNQGYEVEGVTLDLWQEERGPAFPSSNAQEDARKVCERLGIRHHMLDVKQLFYNRVVSPFVQEYQAGRTPNPCVMCNKFVKFGAMADYAWEHNFDAIATGHYAQVRYDEKTNRTLLCRAAHERKDQSYVLYNLTQKVLSRLLLPLGAFDKEEVYALAKQAGMEVADKKESQEICFIPDKDYVAFLQRNSKETAADGWFLNRAGERIGRHQGIYQYTIGQRKGLGAFGKPMFVLAINYADNTIVLGEKGQEFSDGLIAAQPNFILFDEWKGPMRALGKIRYKAELSPCTVTMETDGRVRVEFDNPQRAPAPGQAVVFYQDDMVIGGATIEKIF